MTITNLKIGIVVARFNDIVTSRLAAAAKKTLLQQGVLPENILEIEVPGSFEIPFACQAMIDHQKPDGVIALGAVIRGTTNHYDYVCSGVTSGLMNVQLSRGVPIGFGILTCDTLEQAFDRAGGKLGNKGAETALAVLELANLNSSMKK